MVKQLFSKDIKGKIKQWCIEKKDNSIIVTYGFLNMNTILTTINYNNIDTEIASRIAKKRKEGYKSLSDLNYDNKEDITIFLTRELPKFSTDNNLNLRPMKCQKFQEGKVKYPVLAQPKLNGLRAVLRWETWEEGEGMFKETKEGAKIRTKEGNEYIMPHITKDLTKDMFESEVGELVFDGELYKHGMGLNIIKSSCPMTNNRGTISRPSGRPEDVSFYIFDLAIPDVIQKDRLDILGACKIIDMFYIKPINYNILNSDEEVLEFRDQMIKLGYEGCVIRDPDEEYAFGFRPSFIRKCKQFMDSEFLIIDLIPKPADPSLPLFILKNDLNDEVFECNPTGSYEEQREWLINSEDYIGMWATVRYRERSGVRKVPFHANVIGFRKLKNEG